MAKTSQFEQSNTAPMKLNLKNCDPYLDPNQVLELQVPVMDLNIHEQMFPIGEMLKEKGFTVKEIDDAFDVFFGNLQDVQFMKWIKDKIVR